MSNEQQGNLLVAGNLQALEQYLAFKKNHELQKWLSEFSEVRFNSNLMSFKTHYSELFYILESVNFNNNLELFCDENGFCNIFNRDSGDFFYATDDTLNFCSSQSSQFVRTEIINEIKTEYQHDPFGQIHYKYLNQIVSQRLQYERKCLSLESYGSVPSILFLGVGLGYQIAETLEKLRSRNIVIVEPDLDLFFLSLFVFDWKNLIDYFSENNIRVRFVIGDKTDYILLYLKHFFAHHGSFLSFGLTVFKHYSSPQTDRIEQLIQSSLSFFLSLGFFDDYLFGLSHTYHNLSNKKQFVIDNNIKAPYDSTPVFIIGAGPSLDKNISFLRQFQDKAIIIACGTAIDSLYHAGIQPDFYANTERVPEISQALDLIPDKNFLSKIILLSTSVCSPKVVSFFTDTALFGKNNEFYLSFLSNYVKELKNIKSIEGINPLVGNMGVSGALHLGFKRLYLFGLDNGRKIGEDYLHSKFTYVYRKGPTGDKGALNLYEDANFGGKVETNSLYKECAYRIGELIERFLINKQDVICFNCSDGIAIQNTIPKKDCDLVDEFAKLPSISKESFNSYFKDNFVKKINFEIDNSHLKAMNYEFIKLTEEILEKIDAKFDSRIECIESLESISEFLSNLLLEENFYASCLNGSLQQMFAHIMGQLYSNQDEQACLAEVRDLIKIVKVFLCESRELFGYLPDYLMGEHRKFFPDGRVGKDMPNCKAPLFPSQFKVVHNEYDDPQKTFIKLYK